MEGLECHPVGVWSGFLMWLTVGWHPRLSNVTPLGFDVTPLGFDVTPWGFDVTTLGFDVAPLGFDVTPWGLGRVL